MIQPSELYWILNLLKVLHREKLVEFRAYFRKIHFKQAYVNAFTYLWKWPTQKARLLDVERSNPNTNSPALKPTPAPNQT